MLSVAMRKTKPATPSPIHQELPQSGSPSVITVEKEIPSPTRNIKCTFDNADFGISPPGKNFLVNLKSRIDKM